jgi:hypothetical protein
MLWIAPLRMDGHKERNNRDEVKREEWKPTLQSREQPMVINGA